MKKIISLFLTLLLLLSAIPGFAQYVENKDYGIYFALSDDWKPGNVNGMMRYRYKGSGNEYIDIEQVPLNGIELTMADEQKLLEISKTVMSDEKIEKKLSEINDTEVTVNTSYTNSEYLVYNSVKYFRYEKTYTVKAKGFNPATFYDYMHSTIKNNKLYVITYSRISSQNHSDEFIDFMNTLYYNLNEIKIIVNGKILQPDSAPFIENSRTLVPVRAIAEALNYKVDWNEEKRLVKITSADNKTTLAFCIDQFDAVKNDSVLLHLDAAPKIVNGRTYLPIRAVAEAMGTQVNWDQAAQTVIIFG